MLPTPDTSHVSYSRVYEPAEDSFLILDTLSSASETAFLQERFPSTSPAPLVLEVGSGSGVVVGFVNAHARALFGHRFLLTCGVDLNGFACRATVQTVRRAEDSCPGGHGMYLGSWTGDLVGAVRPNEVDVLVFNPPYVPTPEMPRRPEAFEDGAEPAWDGESYLLSLSQNRPEDVVARIAAMGGGWRADVVGSSGKTAGWEKLCVLRIWRHG
ncbi:methyltransferase [Metarhizium rileyi]|uniref:Methyltransferase n=1 Tax=Metarhizium rileyi (strain RCEF 4871) TaxID=1649241 RepID=A0A162JIM8_METRR|nr:methyltransferase [Metarhizium rileyi RCEF 4871]